MSEIKNPFDIETDYLKLIASEDKAEENGRQYPYLRGLKKLAFQHRGGVKAVRSKVVKTPNVAHNGDKTSNPDCIAAVTVAYEFNDGTVFEASADASFKAHKKPFNLHLVAIAESKATARAIRSAFNIHEVSKEEIGSEEDERDKSPINDAQLQGIKTVAKRKGLSPAEVLKVAKIDRTEDITELTNAEAVSVLAAINRYKVKN